MHWHRLPGRSILSADGNVGPTGGRRVRVNHCGTGDYLFNIDYNPHTPNACPALANITVQAFGPNGQPVRPATTPRRYLDCMNTVYWNVQLQRQQSGIAYFVVSFRVTPSSTGPLRMGRVLHAGCKVI